MRGSFKQGRLSGTLWPLVEPLVEPRQRGAMLQLIENNGGRAQTRTGDLLRVKCGVWVSWSATERHRVPYPCGLTLYL